MVAQYWQVNCKFCGGTGIQFNRDGLRVKCPECAGTGKRWVSNFDGLPPGVYCFDYSGCSNTCGNYANYEVFWCN